MAATEVRSLVLLPLAITTSSDFVQQLSALPRSSQKHRLVAPSFDSEPALDHPWCKHGARCSANVQCPVVRFLEAGGYGLSRKMLLATPAAFWFGRIQCASSRKLLEPMDRMVTSFWMTEMMIIITTTIPRTSCIACLVMVDCPLVSDFGTLLLGDTVATTTVSWCPPGQTTAVPC